MISMANKSQKRFEEKSTQLKHLSNLKDNETLPEINHLINSPDFINFVSTICETLDDGMTYDELLSSKIILQKALRILKKLEKDNNQK